MVDYRKFKLNSNFKMDNVVFVKEQTLTGSGGSFTATIAHGLPFMPLAFGLYSADGGNTWSQLNFQTQRDNGSVYSDNANIYVVLYIMSAPATVKIRLFAFAPTTATSANVSSPTPLSRFFINSNFGYDMLIKADKVNVPNSSSSQTVFTHNLGYIPRVMVWEETAGNTLLMYSTSKTNMAGYISYSYPELTSTQFKIMNYSNQGASTRTFHYRLYGGQNA